MGLFSRKESAKESGGSTRKRAATSTEAQLDSLRGRARRRLIGALALVVAAIIVVPMIIKTQPEPEAVTPVVLPTPIPPMPGTDLAANEPMAESGVLPSDPGTITLPPELPVPDDTLPEAPADNAEAPAEVAAPTPSPEPQPEPRAEPDPKPAEQAPAKPKPAPSDRSDDGSVALALLEGRSPPASASPPAAAAAGSFVLQIAAYTTSQDAQARRDNLAREGVTNAFVEEASPGGKATYRLRVGPFPTREAAQAAQTRLRTLGYPNSFISSK